MTSGQIAPFQKVPAPEELAAHGAQVVNSGAPRFLLEDCFYVSGEIPRVSSFEKGRPDHLCRRAVDQPWEPDPLILDERYVAVNVQRKGLIVFSSCSHAGIVNVLLNAREAFPDVPLFVNSFSAIVLSVPDVGPNPNPVKNPVALPGDPLVVKPIPAER